VTNQPKPISLRTLVLVHLILGVVLLGLGVIHGILGKVRAGEAIAILQQQNKDFSEPLSEPQFLVVELTARPVIEGYYLQTSRGIGIVGLVMLAIAGAGSRLKPSLPAIRIGCTIIGLLLGIALVLMPALQKSASGHLSFKIQHASSSSATPLSSPQVVSVIRPLSDAARRPFATVSGVLIVSCVAEYAMLVLTIQFRRRRDDPTAT